MFGQTSGGAFSPYASDGKKPITLQVVDTEYSILDALFYPWIKDINSPWWYRPEDVYTQWATPYPMATLEVQRPRMRYRPDAQPEESRNDAKYTYYSYKFIGAKPTSYGPFEVNGAGRSNLLRNLTMTCDMCIVDLTSDVSGSSGESMNVGNRTKFIFEELPSPSSEDSNQDDNEQHDDDGDETLEEYEQEDGDLEAEIENNIEDMD